MHLSKRMRLVMMSAAIATVCPIGFGTFAVFTTRWIAWISGSMWDPSWGEFAGGACTIIGLFIGWGLVVLVTTDKSGSDA